MSSEMEEFKQIFFTEAGELLAEMEERLLKLDEGSQDMDQLNAIFRCAHSIKGGAGAFGFDAIMRFTHKLEALLDAMRSGSIVPSRASIDVLLKAADIVTQMLGTAQQGSEPAAGFGNEVIAQLEAFTVADATPELPAAAPSASQPEPGHGMVSYDITFQPTAHLLATGNEPLLILRELGRLGDIGITANLDGIPMLSGFDPHACYIGWRISLTTAADAQAIEDAFEFVRDLADITITCKELTPPLAAATEITTLPSVAAAPSSDNSGATTKTGAGASSIRVDIDKIDRLVNMVGELVITEAMLRAQLRGLPEDAFSDLIRGINKYPTIPVSCKKR